MARHGYKYTSACLTGRYPACVIALLICITANRLEAQAPSQTQVTQQIQQLTDSMARTQSQLEESRRQLDEMRKQLAALQTLLAQGSTIAQATTHPVPVETEYASTTALLQDVLERQSVQEAQIATHEQTKVETESKYPVKITGMLLLNGFVNTSAVNQADAPELAVRGAGSTGASIRQTVLGLDAHGPHVFGASSYADLRVDFFGRSQTGSSDPTYSGYFTSASTFMRLRTAHAGLHWTNTEAYFSLDRPILNPDTPTSITAVAEPALAWSGSLWAWNPQFVVAHDLTFGSSHSVRLQGALIDTGNAPLSPVITGSTPGGTLAPADSEQSRWPGLEARVAFVGDKTEDGKFHVGVGGYFSPHLSTLGRRYDSWAATLDTRINLPERFELTGNFYRGAALGGLGEGAYKDYGYRAGPAAGTYRLRPLSDVGGWAQIKRKLGERLELNGAFGIDNVFANEMRRYPLLTNSIYEALARNRTLTGNVIFSPSAYLLFSFEYRNIRSTPIAGPAANSDVLGLAAGYKF